MPQDLIDACAARQVDMARYLLGHSESVETYFLDSSTQPSYRHARPFRGMDNAESLMDSMGNTYLDLNTTFFPDLSNSRTAGHGVLARLLLGNGVGPSLREDDSEAGLLPSIRSHSQPAPIRCPVRRRQCMRKGARPCTMPRETDGAGQYGPTPARTRSRCGCGQCRRRDAGSFVSTEPGPQA
ncbi:uncharacterized protein PG986_005468 [Apiospora aurea]|uniref:Uncharacterized protein n=1 Tax=Apiospora aurea TaxID=335848 RepID=A0ABR1QJ26_9PEZI